MGLSTEKLCIKAEGDSIVSTQRQRNPISDNSFAIPFPFVISAEKLKSNFIINNPT
jgi:hypothetical protein